MELNLFSFPPSCHKFNRLFWASYWGRRFQKEIEIERESARNELEQVLTYSKFIITRTKSNKLQTCSCTYKGSFSLLLEFSSQYFPQYVFYQLFVCQYDKLLFSYEYFLSHHCASTEVSCKKLVEREDEQEAGFEPVISKN